MNSLDKLSLVSVVLQTSEIEHTVEHTGGGVFVIYVPLPNDHHLGISVTDPSLPWARADRDDVLDVFCYDSSDADDEGISMILEASTALALAAVLEALGRTFFTIPSEFTNAG